MHDLPSYRMPPRRAPSFLNREAALGALAGFGLLIGGPMAVPVALLGAGVGAVLGRLRMQEESKNGVVVKPPTFWNQGLLFGALAGFATILPMTLVLGAVGTGLGALFGATQLAGIAMAAAPWLSMAIGTFMGGIGYQRQMQGEYMTAHRTGKIMPETIRPSPLEEVGQAPAIPTLAPRGPGEAKETAPAPVPPEHYGDDAQKLRSFLDEEMRRRALPKTQYPFNGRG